MEEEILQKYKKAGDIYKSIRVELTELIKPGVKILDIAEFIEKKIIENGGKPAFPVNISINDVAAHYTPVLNDIKVIEKGDLVKIDIGTHVEGYISDAAFTYCNEKHPFIICAEECVNNAINVIKPGVTVGEITESIENTAKEHKLGLIVNLTGHTLDKYVGHGAPSIPNSGPKGKHVFNEGDVLALEPFICQNNAFVKDTGIKEIYNFLIRKPIRLTEARQILELADKEYHGLPFAKRWLFKKFSPVKVSLSLRQLEAVGAIISHPMLRGPDNKPIAQHEHTIIVADPPIVTTL